jgi:membrane complex biogenesis BtpA family protein
VETVAALSAVARELKRQVVCPIGLNVLRNDGEAALAIATAVGASIIRVNVHCGAVVSEQGIMEGAAHETLRLRSALRGGVLIFADVGVKHARPLIDRGLVTETKDVIERGCADAVIVSGERTGSETPAKVVQEVRRATEAPLLIGSGATPENIGNIFGSVNGMIVGSYFKSAGQTNNFVERSRVKALMAEVYKLRNRNADAAIGQL